MVEGRLIQDADKRPDKLLHNSYFSFFCRFGLILLLDYYVSPRWAEEVFLSCERVKKGEYYVNMAIAWLLSVCYVKMKEETKTYLKNCSLDEEVLKMTKRKILESYRVSDEEKDYIRKNGVK